MEDRTSLCGNRVGWDMISGERPIELYDSWFFAKAILVAYWLFFCGSRERNEYTDF